MRNSRLVVLANKTGKKLAEKICEDMGLDQDLINIQRFNDTEILPELKESVRDADVFYICPFYPDPKGRLVETMFVADALRCAVPERKIAIPTYLGFMRSDKPEGRTSINIRKVAETFENDGWDYVASIHIHNKA
ncbi:MAG: ribose-phosphate pyrophosphokinase-like domain-containing protein, partial [Candidatus Pacearchaeota archaeon]